MRHMPTYTTERAITDTERQFLQHLLKGTPTFWTRWGRGSENALVLWAVCMAVYIPAWGVVAWLLRRTMHVDVGWQSDYVGSGIVLGVLGSAVVAGIASSRWVQSWRDYRPLFHADLESGRVVEEHYRFTEAKRFQEPEHGGLIYFLHTDDDRVLTFFDYDSQDLGVREADPLQSRFVPRTDLTIVRAPRSALVIEKRFSGEPLPTGAPLLLTVEPGEWPESDMSCDIPWEQLERRLSSRGS
jgi:hypothetical protein